MKKSHVCTLAAALLSFIIMISSFLPTTINVAYASQTPRIRIDGQFIDVGDQPPVIIDGRTLVPVRAVFEPMGFAVSWCDDYQMATLISNRYTVEVYVNMAVMVVTNNNNGTRRDVLLRHYPPRIINDRVMLPLRGIAEATGMDVAWCTDERIADITTGNVASTPVPPTTEPTEQPTSPSVEAPEPTQPDTTIPETTQPTTQLPSQPATDVTPVLFDDRIMLSSAELAVLAATAPSVFDTLASSSITHTGTMFTNSELADWIAEYKVLGMNDRELEIIRLINEYRVSNGLHPLMLDPILSMAARFHSHEMMDLGYFAHRSPVTGSSGDRAEMFGHVNMHDWVTGAHENITTMSDPAGAVENFINSPGHRAALIAEDFLSIGVGIGGGGTVVKFGA